MSDTTTSSVPAWWSPDMQELVARRDCIRGVDKWQTTYVRYKCQHEAVKADNGWELAVSKRLLEHAVTDQQRYMLKDHPFNSGLCPTSINLKILEAPAEYGLPVKQDRRLTPDFKVRVEVKYRGRVQFPMSLRAYIITQQERDSLHSWVPDDVFDPESPKRKHITELKGTTAVTHLFEANANGASYYTSPHQNGRRLSGQGLPMTPSGSFNSYPQSGMSNRTGGYMDMSGGGGMQGSMQGGMDPRDPLSLPTDPLMHDPLALHSRESVPIKQDPYADYSYNQIDSMGFPNLDAMGPQGVNPSLSGTMSGSMGGYNSGVLQPLDSWDHEYDNVLMHQLLHSAGNYSSSSLLQQLEGGYSVPHMMRHPTGGAAIKQEGMRYPSPVEPVTSSNGHGSHNGLAHTNHHHGQSPPQLPPEAVLAHDCEFANVEFVRPTRMNKVYMVFACSVYDHDVLFVMYDIPTVGICRAEQKTKACQKLGVPFPEVGHIDHLYTPPLNLSLNNDSPVTGGGGIKRHNSMATLEENDLFSNAGPHPYQRRQAAAEAAAAAAVMPHQQAAATAGQDDYTMSQLPRSRRALREWILEEYENTGLTRKLSKQDIEALESQAGFPSDTSSDVASVSQTQWDEFKGQFATVLTLLSRIAPVWNLEDPCLISGFDMDRQGTVQALAHEPAGTFICRFSMSQPGCLVLTCKVNTGHPNADSDGLVHALVKIDDLNERRVDTWIRDFPAATHILDVYKQKRVDKRKVFASNYTRLRALDLPEGLEGLL